MGVKDRMSSAGGDGNCGRKCQCRCERERRVVLWWISSRVATGAVICRWILLKHIVVTRWHTMQREKIRCNPDSGLGKVGTRFGENEKRNQPRKMGRLWQSTRGSIQLQSLQVAIALVCHVSLPPSLPSFLFSICQSLGTPFSLFSFSLVHHASFLS